jgi:phosphomannomutase
VIAASLAAVESDPTAEVAGVRVTRVVEKDGVKYEFAGEGWLLHRLSGTEPMVRLYCEHVEQETVERVLDETEGRLREFAKRGGTS